MSQQMEKLPNGQQMVPELLQKIEKLEHEAVMSKDYNKYLDKKLDKVLGDRIVLRNENYKLKRRLNLKEQVSNKFQGTPKQIEGKMKKDKAFAIGMKKYYGTVLDKKGKLNRSK